MFLTCFDAATLFFAKPCTKMTVVSSFSHQQDACLHKLTVVLGENLVLLVVLVPESKALECSMCQLRNLYGANLTFHQLA